MTASRSRYALSLSMTSNVDRRLACPRTVDFRLPMSLDLCQALAQSPRAVAALAAFRSVTGFNVTLLPTDGRPSLNGSKTSASPLCDLILKTPAGRVACGQVLAGLQSRLCRNAQPRRLECFAGMCKFAAPVLAEGRPIAILLCGRVLPRKKTSAHFTRLMQRLGRMGIALNRAHAARAYHSHPVGTTAQLDAVSNLLDVLAEHLAGAANGWLLATHSAEPAPVARAKLFIQARLGKRLTLRQVAAATGLCPQYFCRLFKRATGASPTAYRATKAKG